MLYVITEGARTGPRMQAFLRKCTDAYNVLRRHHALLLHLFSLMLPSGIPELSHETEAQYVRDALRLDLDDREAAAVRCFVRQPRRAALSDG